MNYTTNISNYSGQFEYGANYKQFDYVYYTGDSTFYYAQQDIEFGAGALLTGIDRVAFIPNGPLVADGQSHYILDTWNSADSLGKEIKIGHILSVQGSNSSNDGNYRVVDIQKDLTSVNNDPTLTGTAINVFPLQDSMQSFEAPGENLVEIFALNAAPNDNLDVWSFDKFFFDADYGSSVSFKTNNYKYEYGNGYYHLQPESINSINFDVNLKFKNRTNRETNAIIHFLENHQGQQEKDKPSTNLKYSQGISGFRWVGSSTFHPYDSIDMQTKEFYCESWSHNMNFENSNDIDVKLSNFNTSLLRKSESLFVKPADSYLNSDYYEVNDVVLFEENQQYYYCKSESPVVDLPPIQSNEEWTRSDGYFSEINKNIWTRDFFWKPSIGLNVSQSPRMNRFEAEGAYKQIYKDGINESLLSFDLKFQNRGDDEAYAILHFLEHHYGAIPFMFSPPSPYDKQKNFVCPEWTHTYNFKNNHTITARFEEFPFPFSSQQIDNIITPAISSPGEITVTPVVTLSTEEDEMPWNATVRKRVNIMNIGGEVVDLLSIARKEGDPFFELLSFDDYGYNYIPDGYVSSGFISTAIIDDIYLDICGSVIPADLKKALTPFVDNWQVVDLVYAVLNSAEFLESSPNSDKINIVTQDVFGRIASASELSTFGAMANMEAVVKAIKETEEFYTVKQKNVKVIIGKLSSSDMVINLPFDKLTNLGLNGKKIRLFNLEETGQEFEDIDSAKRYFQYNDGSIRDISGNQTYECKYFVNKRLFLIHGKSEINSSEKGYIDLIYKNENLDSVTVYLEDHQGNIIEWVNSGNNVGGNIKVESTSKNFEAQFEIKADYGFVNFIAKAFALSEEEKYIPDTDVAIPMSLGDSGIMHAPFIRVDSGYQEHRGLRFIELDVSSADYQEVETSIVWMEPRFPDDIGMWVEYEYIAYGSSSGGLLMPRGFNNQDAKENASWSSSNSSPIEIISDQIDLSEINNYSHTLLSVEEITDQDQIPEGYDTAYIQRGLCKIGSEFIDGKIVSYYDESTQSYSYQDVPGISTIGKASPKCWIKTTGPCAGNLKLNIKNYATQYGIIYNAEFQNYDVVDQDGSVYISNVSKAEAVYRYKELYNLNRYKRFIVNDSSISCASSNWWHVVSSESSQALKNCYNSSISGTGDMFLTKGIVFLDDGDYFLAENYKFRSPLPEVYNGGLRLHVNINLNLSQEQIREVNLAKSVWESVITDPISIEIDIYEDEMGRFGNDIDENTIAWMAYQANSAFIDGMRSVNSKANLLRPFSGTMGVSPIYLDDPELHLDVKASYSDQEVSPFYYTMLHEMGHVFGYPSAWKMRYLFMHVFYPGEEYFRFEGSSDIYAFTNDPRNWFRQISSEESRILSLVYAYDDLLGKIQDSSGTVYVWQFLGQNAISQYQNLIQHYQLHLATSARNNLPFYFETVPLSIGDGHLSENGYWQTVGNERRIQVTFSDELMSPVYPYRVNWVMSPYNKPAPLSRITLGILEDIGFSIDYSSMNNDDIYLSPNTSGGYTINN
jgi:phage-related protein